MPVPPPTRLEPTPTPASRTAPEVGACASGGRAGNSLDGSSPEGGIPEGGAVDFEPESGRAASQDFAAGRRLPWLLGGALVVLAGLFLGLARWRGAREWRRFQIEAAAVEAAIDAREPARPVLWGDAEVGDAWPHYRRALASFGPSPADDFARVARTEGARLTGSASTDGAGKPMPAPRPTAEVLAELTDALAELRTGAHLTDGRRPVDWSAGFNLHIESLLAARALANAAVLAAIVAARDGDAAEAAHRLLDAAQLGRDFAQSPVLIEQMIGCALLGIVCKDALEWANLPRHLDAPALRTLSDGLARLDASLPLGSDWLAAEAALFANYDTAAAFGAGPFSTLEWRSWRYGFSVQLALASHGLAQLRLAGEVRALSQHSDSLDVAAIEARFDALATSGNPVTALVTPNLTSALRNRLRTLALVRLLRMAVQHARGETVELQPDPAGGTLRWQVDTSGDAEFWSDHDGTHTRLRLRR